MEYSEIIVSMPRDEDSVLASIQFSSVRVAMVTPQTANSKNPSFPLYLCQTKQFYDNC